MTGRRVGLAAAALSLVPVLGACGESSPDEESALPSTVFVGDSITSGVSTATMGPSDEFSWVTYALDDPRTPWRFAAKDSQFGLTLEEMHQRFAVEVLPLEPEAVVIMGGTNDALRQLPVEQSTTALRAMIEDSQAAGAEVWVVGPPPLDESYQRPLAPYVDAERDLAAELDVPFVDLSTALIGDDGRWLPGLSNDGVHPTVEGAQEIARLVLDEFGR